MSDRHKLILAPKDLYRIPDFSDLSRSALYRRVGKIRDFAGKKRKQPITVIDVADWLGVEPEYIEGVFI